MWAAIFRSRAFSLSSPYSHVIQSWKLGFPCVNRTLWTSFVDYNSNNENDEKKTLNLQEVEKVLSDVKADDVKVIPVHNHCDYTDFMVIATGRSTWHVKNIAQALIYKAKQKQKDAERLLLPSVEGQEGGKWIVIDSGPVIIHALDEKARSYYKLENLWMSERPTNKPDEGLEKTLVKVRPKNNSKKKPVLRST